MPIYGNDGEGEIVSTIHRRLTFGCWPSCGHSPFGLGASTAILAAHHTRASPEGDKPTRHSKGTERDAKQKGEQNADEVRTYVITVHATVRTRQGRMHVVGM